MSRYLHTLDFSGSAPALFEALRQYFHEKGFHLEEADAVTLRLHAEKTRGLMSALFGLGTLHVFISFPKDGGVSVRLSHPAPALVRDLQEIADAAHQTPASLAGDTPAGPTTIIVREIVRIPGRFCGSLVENTQARCPYCGGEIR